MSTLYTIFITVIVLEVLGLVGIIWAWRKLHEKKEQLMTARIQLSRSCFEMTRSVRTGNQSIQQVDKVFQLLLKCAPPWLKVAVTVMRWLGKVSPRIS